MISQLSWRRWVSSLVWDRSPGQRRVRRRITNSRIESLEQRVVLTVELIGTVNWVAMGATPIINGQTENIDSTGPGANTVVGAIHDIATHPSNSDIAFLGTVNSGVWRTTDFTSQNPTYTPLTTQFPGTSIGTIEFDPTDATSNTLVAGIGRYSSFFGIGGPQTGLLRTTDGGDTWNQLGTADLAGRNISGVAARGSTIVVSANNFGNGIGGGVYRSINSGTDFTLISGSVNGPGAGAAFDLVGDSTNINRLYVSVGGVGIFVSPDQGATWANISSGDASLNTAITTAGNNNLEMAVSPTTGRIYAGVVRNGQLRYMGYSDNQGGTWTEMDLPVTTDTEGTFSTSPSAKPGSQGATHFSIVVDPNDANLVYVGGDRQPGNFPNGANSLGALDFSGRLFRGNAAIAAANPGNTTIVGSAQWDHLTHTQNLVFNGGGTADGSAPHADSRDMEFRADGTLIEVDDGGIYGRTSPATNTGVWFSKNSNAAGGLQVTAMHDIAYDTISNILLSGNQDTGTTQQTTTGSLVWTAVPFVPAVANGTFGPINFSNGDGGDVAVDNLVGGGQSIRYSSFQNLALFRRQTYDAANVLISQVFPTLTGYLNDPQFVTPIAVNDVAANRLVIVGAANIYESTDNGDNLNVIAATGGNNAIAYGAGGNAEALFVGVGNSVWGRTVAGAINPTSALPAGAGTIVDVELNSADFNTVVAVDGNQVFLTSNAGGLWSDITGNLNDGTLRSVKYIDNPGAGPDAILAGGAGGVFRMTTDNLGVWDEYGTGLSNSIVHDMDYDVTDDVLVIGTMGRGAWVLPSLTTSVFTGDSRALIINGDMDFAGQDDTILLTLDPNNPAFVDVFVNGQAFGPYEIALIDQIVVNGLGGNDTLNVDSTEGLLSSPISFDGGLGFDQLNLTQTGGPTRTSSRVNVGANPGDGQSIIDTQVVNFQNIEPVTDNVAAATFTLSSVAGIASLLDASNSINYTDALILTTAGRITVDNFEPVEFDNKTNLVVDAGAGSDTINLNNPNTPTGLTGAITVNGGDPTASDTLIINGRPATGDNIRLLPTGTGAGTLTGNGAASQSFTGIEHISVVLQPGTTDFFTIDGTTGNDNLHVTSGVAVGQSHIEGIMNTGVGAFALPSIDVSGNSTTVIGNFNFNGVAGTDTFTLTGTSSNDTFDVVRTGATTGAVTHRINGLVTNFVGLSNFANVEIEGLEGNDTFNVSGDLAFALLVNGGDPTASDVLNFTGTGANVAVNLGSGTVAQTASPAVTYTGIEILNADAATGNATLTASASDDVVDVTPTSVNAVTFALVSSNPDIGSTPIVNLSNIGTTMTLDGAGGINSLNFYGTSNLDLINLSRTSGSLTLENVSRQIVTTTSSFFEWNVLGGAGSDQFTINEPAGITVIEINLDGGTGSSNSLVYNTAFNQSYAPAGGNNGTLSGAGDIGFSNLSTATVNFTNAGNVATVQAGAGNNQVTVIGTAASTANVSVDNGTLVTFTGTLATLNVNAGSGDDSVAVTPGTFTGAGGINVASGDPTASDTLIVNGTAGNDAIAYNPSATIGAGSVTVAGAATVNFTTTESVKIDGQGGADDLTINTPAGGNNTTYTPGTAFDSGTIALRQFGAGTALVPLTFSHIGAFGSVTFAGSGVQTDNLELNGTSNSDTFTLTGSTAQILDAAGNLFVTDVLNLPGISGITLHGLDGDDTFNVAGPLLPLISITVDGGNPSASDVINYAGTGAAVTVSYAAGTVTETGVGTFNSIGVEVLNIDTVGGDLNVTATNGDDVLSVTPTGASSATARLVSSNPGIGGTPVVNGSNIGALNVDLLGGSDRLVVNATQAGETVTVTGVLVTVGALETVNYANVDDLQIIGQGGSDTFNVTPSATTTIFVDGGDPIGVTPGDLLNLLPPAAFVVEAGPEIDEGGLRGVNMQRVSWDHIEAISINGPGPAKIVGTNGDDDITVIARDASTHAGADGVQDFTVSINNGLSILFLNQATLLIDALAGDDDIVVRAPAPNNAVWNVALTVAGGTPAAATGVQGDILEYETPGQQTITYTPGAILGTGVINDTTLATTITIAQFLCPVDNLPSSPGSIEKLILDGEGGNDSVTVIGSAGTETFEHTPGSASDAGAISVNSLLGLTYEDLGAGAILAIDGSGGTDTLVVNGTNSNDTFGVLVNGNVTQAGHLTLTRVDYENLTIRGLDGDDTFNHAAGAIVAVTYEGGDPTASDVLNYTSTANAATTLDLEASTIAQTGPNSGTVSFNGVEHVNLISSGAASTLTVTGTPNSDTINVSPSGAGAGSFVRSGISGTPQFTYAGVGAAFTVTGGSGGFDTLAIVGDDAADVVTSTATTVTIKGGTVTLGAGLEYLNISTLGGDDNVTLTGLAIAKTIDAGDGNDRVDLSAAVDALILGGAGNDILIGSPAVDQIYGGSGNDILIGGGGIDEEYGEDGNDQFGDLSLAGNGVADDAGADNLFGGDGVDTFIWEPGDGSDVISGGDAGTDVLRFFGNAAANTFNLTANAGNATHFNLNLGAATVDTSGIEQVFLGAGLGADVVTVADLTTTEIKSVSIDLGAGDADTVTVNGRNTADTIAISSAAAGSVSIQGFVYTLNLSNAATTDTLTVNGNEGDDSIKANTGVENTIGIILNGNDGNDVLTADAVINGGNGNDTIQGGAGGDTLNGNDGDDTFLFVAGAGLDTIDGGNGFDVFVVTSNGSDNVISVSETAVTVDAGTENLAVTNLEQFRVNSGDGNDTVTVSLATVPGVIDAGAGDDIVNGTASAATLTIRGGDGNDSLTGGSGADLIFGGAGNDTLIGGAGVDQEYGESGNDRFGDASLTGNGAADDAGADFLFGADGIDQFVWEPGDGSDIVQGGDDGADILRFIGSAAAEAFALAANAGAPTHFNLTLGGATVDTHGVEQVILTAGAGADTVTVGDLTTTEIGAVNIDLGAGDADAVTLNGRNTADTLAVTSPAAGLVTVQGLSYDINISNAAVADTLTVNGNEGNDSIKVNTGVETTIGIVLNGNDGDDFLSADAVINGGNGDDTIEGGAGADTLNGNAGNDTFLFVPGTGVDTIDGGTGFDVYLVNANGLNNTINVSQTAATVDGATENLSVSNLEQFQVNASDGDDSVTITLATVPGVITGGAGDDIVNGSGSAAALTIRGGEGNDTLTGGSVADQIYGGAGNDLIIGGAGVDQEYGEEGNDQFGDASINGNGVADDAGADLIFGGDGADTFIWEPGDGSDIDQGGDDQGDVLRFLGSAAANAFLLSANASNPSHFNLNLGAATVDTAGVEQVVLNALAGADTVTVEDLTKTEIKSLNIDLGAGDADAVTVNGRVTADNIAVGKALPGSVAVQGLDYDLNLSNVAQADTLTINGNEGNDLIKANDGVENTIGIVFNGGLGDDYLSADATLNGDAGDDTLIGGAGVDTLNGGDGDDFLTGLGGADVFDGGAGYDTIVETRNANFTLTDTALTIGAEGVDTLTSMENALLTGGQSGNTFFIGAFTGDTTVTGAGGSDTVDFSAATQGIHIDLDAKDVDQVINLAGRTIVFGDIIENLRATNFDDTINVDIAQFNRFIDGGLENAIPPGDRLNVDLLGSNANATKVPNGKLGSFDGTVNGSGFTGTITYEDIETLVIKGANSTPPDFSSSTQYDMGDGPRSVVTADLNGDGILDMVTANSLSNDVSVRFGDGFGSFDGLATYSAGGKKAKQTTTVAVGDFDGDGDLDLVVTNRRTNNVSVLLNNGTGVFGAATLFDTGVKQSGKFPTSVKLGDMNNDGSLDIVTANANVRKNGSISILTGNGAGGFGAANVTKTLSRRTRDLELVDVNADGNLDVVAVDLFSKNVVVMTGNGAGGLAAPVSTIVGITPNSIISGDFNGDGVTDFAVTSLVTPRISILLGTGLPGGPAFQPEKEVKYPATELDISINTGDINGDGNLDLLIANRNDNTLSYMLGNGNGTFDNRVDFKTGGTIFREPVSIAVGDFNNDGALDLMVACAGSDDVSVLIHDPIV